MKKRTLAGIAATLLATLAAHAAIVVPGAYDSDGALNITKDTVIDLSQAVTGKWDDNNAANAGKGVYDPQKWAVVFKYTDVKVAAGATVRFKNHKSRAPVVWLVSNSAVIEGTVSLDGGNWRPSPWLSEPGPGGFRGGRGAEGYGQGQQSSGFGPGGAAGHTTFDGVVYNGGGSYGQSGTRGTAAYGNPSLVPLIGGSGSAGHWGDQSGGGGGGGAFMLAVQNSIVLSGKITARGGYGIGGNTGGHGAGGGIRLICDDLSGSGLGLYALGAGDQNSHGGAGRIRIERVVNHADFSAQPDPSVIDLPDNSTALLWPPPGAPEVRIVSIGSVNTPPDPSAEFGTIGADIALPLVSSTQAVIETKNVEINSVVKVRVTPRSNGNFTEVPAVKDTVVSEDPLVVLWKADLPVNVGYSAVQVKVVRP